MSDDMTGKNQYLALYPVPKNHNWCQEIFKNENYFLNWFLIWHLTWPQLQWKKKQSNRDLFYPLPYDIFTNAAYGTRHGYRTGTGTGTCFSCNTKFIKTKKNCPGIFSPYWGVSFFVHVPCMYGSKYQRTKLWKTCNNSAKGIFIFCFRITLLACIFKIFFMHQYIQKSVKNLVST